MSSHGGKSEHKNFSDYFEVQITEGVQETFHDAGRGRDVHLQPQGRTFELKKWMASGQDHPNDNPGDPRWSRSSPPRPGGTQSGSLRSWTRWRRSSSTRSTPGCTAGQGPGASAITFSLPNFPFPNMHVWLYFSFWYRNCHQTVNQSCLPVEVTRTTCRNRFLNKFTIIRPPNQWIATRPGKIESCFSPRAGNW